MGFVDCLGALKEAARKAGIKDLLPEAKEKELLAKVEELKAKGMHELEAEREVKNEFIKEQHKALDTKLNELKTKINPKFKGEYKEPTVNEDEVNKVHDKYDELEKQQEEQQKEEKLKDYTSLKNRVYDAERESEGKDVLDTSDPKSLKEAQQEVHDMFKSGEITTPEIREIARSWATDQDIQTKLTPEQVIYALLHDKETLKQEGREIDKKLADAVKSSNEDAAEYLIMDKARNEMDKNNNYTAAKKLKHTGSRILNAAKVDIDEDYSALGFVDRLKETSPDGKISERLESKGKQYAKILEEHENQLAELEAKNKEHEKIKAEHEKEIKDLQDAKLKIEEENSKLEAELALEKAKLGKEKTERTKKSYEEKVADNEKKKQETVDRIRAKYNKIRGTLNAGVDPRLLTLAPDIASLARYHIERGVIELDELIGNIMHDLDIPELSERVVRDLFSGYGKTSKLSDDPNDIKLSQLKSKAKAISGLESVRMFNELPAQSGATFRPMTDEVKAIRREIMDEIRARGIDIKKVKDPQKSWETAVAAYEKRLDNRIKYLENIKETNNIEKYINDKKKKKLNLETEDGELKKRINEKRTLIASTRRAMDQIIKNQDFQKMNNFLKSVEWGKRFLRGVMISNPAIYFKIIGSVAARGISKPVLVLGHRLASMVKPYDMNKNTGINSWESAANHLVTFYSELASKENIKQIKQTFKQHGTDQDLQYGKKFTEIPIPNYDKINIKNFAAASFFWSLKVLEKNAAGHGAGKGFVSRAEFAAWKRTITDNMIDEKMKPKEFADMTLEATINHLANQKALYSKYMQDQYFAGIQDAAEMKARIKGYNLTADVLDILNPIVKIGTNFIGEELEKQPGVGMLEQFARLATREKGKDMTEKQKMDIDRVMAYQVLGVTGTILGAMMYKHINPFYNSDAKDHAKKEGKDLPKEENNIWGVPETWLHSPEAFNMRSGASFMWLWDKYDKEHPEKSGMVNFWKAYYVNQLKTIRTSLTTSPYISMAENTLSPIINGGDVGKAGANFVKGRMPFSTTLDEISKGKFPVINKIAPSLGKYLAEKAGMHEEEIKPSEVGLKPKGFSQNIRIGLPWERENVIKEMLYAEKEKKTAEQKQESKRKSRDKKQLLKEYKREHPND